MENNTINHDPAVVEESFSIQNFIKACLAKWQWFAISVTLFTLLGIVYVVTQQPKYQRTMSILIKDQNGGGGVSDIASSFSSLGLVSTNTNVYNELISLMSPSVMSEVVERLHLDVNYLKKGFPHGTTLYGSNQPFVVDFLDLKQPLSGQFRADIQPDGSMTLCKFRLYTADGVQKFDDRVQVAPGVKVVKTPLGRIQFTPNQRYTGKGYDKPVSIVVSRNGFRKTVEKYTAQLKGDLADRDAEVIDLSIRDVSEQRADDILNAVLDVYTAKYLSDKNRISVATSQFIDDRLGVIEKELGVVDNDIMKYKSENLVPDLAEAAKLNMASTHEVDQEILTVSSQLAMAQYVAEYVKNPANHDAVIPVNTGGPSMQLETQIANYNTTLLARNNMAANSSANNPLVKDYDAQLKGMREAIERGLNSQVVNLRNTLKNLDSAKGDLKGQLASGPNQAKYLLSVERQQKVKEQLYLYLLQKREENELTQTFTADNTRVITPPSGSIKPVSPRKTLTVAIAFLFGLLFPGAVVYIRESSNTKVRSRRDLDRVATPYVGEIPYGGKKKLRFMSWFRRNKKTEKLESIKFTVSAGKRDVINESFRIVRGNIDFLRRANKDQVYMVTSFNAGSGKSFITYNLAASFAIKGKKVLLIDCDLRHGSASQFIGMPSKGVTSFLTRATKDWEHLVIQNKDLPDMHILPIGHRPPNPAELLDTPAMRELIEQARKEYDIVFLDCPPIDVVVDTQILGPYVDSTLFVIRAGLFEKAALAEIDELYHSGKYHKMAIILNGTDQQFSKYGGEHSYYGSAYNVQE